MSATTSRPSLAQCSPPNVRPRGAPATLCLQKLTEAVWVPRYRRSPGQFDRSARPQPRRSCHLGRRHCSRPRLLLHGRANPAHPRLDGDDARDRVHARSVRRLHGPLSAGEQPLQERGRDRFEPRQRQLAGQSSRVSAFPFSTDTTADRPLNRPVRSRLLWRSWFAASLLPSPQSWPDGS
jgi:hypothetical protein